MTTGGDNQSVAYQGSAAQSSDTTPTVGYVQLDAGNRQLGSSVQPAWQPQSPKQDTFYPFGTLRQLDGMGASFIYPDPHPVTTPHHPATALQNIDSNDVFFWNVSKTLDSDINLSVADDASAAFQYTSGRNGLVAPVNPQQEIGASQFAGNAYQADEQFGLGQVPAVPMGGLPLVPDAYQSGQAGPQQLVFGSFSALSEPHANLVPRELAGTTRRRTGQVSRGGHKRGNLVPCTQYGCTTMLGRGAELKRHLQTVHGHGPMYRCLYDYCDYTYGRLDKVRSHMKNVHGLLVEMKRKNGSADVDDDEQ